jgi:hypothetical protein
MRGERLRRYNFQQWSESSKFLGRKRQKIKDKV